MVQRERFAVKKKPKDTRGTLIRIAKYLSDYLWIVILLVARALAADPEILVLDDASSALDYRTDAAMRRAIGENHPESTVILIAQRVSSVMQLDRILVMDNGRCIGLGSHEELMARCPAYKEICDIQMGEL